MCPQISRRHDIFRALCRVRSLSAAWDKVRTNAGCSGGDGETIAGFQHRAARRLFPKIRHAGADPASRAGCSAGILNSHVVSV